MEQDYEAMVAQSAEELFQVMETRIAPQGMERIRDAYDLAYKAHKGQKRKGGQPYIIHPIAVRVLLAPTSIWGQILLLQLYCMMWWRIPLWNYPISRSVLAPMWHFW